MDMEFVQFIIGTIKDFYPDPLNYILVLEMPWVLNGNTKKLNLITLYSVLREYKLISFDFI